MSRDVPFDPRATCDECGHIGAYDFMGDFMCQECTDKYIAERRETIKREKARSR